MKLQLAKKPIVLNNVAGILTLNAAFSDPFKSVTWDEKGKYSHASDVCIFIVNSAAFYVPKNVYKCKKSYVLMHSLKGLRACKGENVGITPVI